MAMAESDQQVEKQETVEAQLEATIQAGGAEVMVEVVRDQHGVVAHVATTTDDPVLSLKDVAAVRQLFEETETAIKEAANV
jgi:hypothetical protein